MRMLFLSAGARFNDKKEKEKECGCDHIRLIFKSRPHGATVLRRRCRRSEEGRLPIEAETKATMDRSIRGADRFDGRPNP